MRIQADTRDELDEAMLSHAPEWSATRIDQQPDGTWWADMVKDDPTISAAAVELRQIGVSYLHSLPILRKMAGAMRA